MRPTFGTVIPTHEEIGLGHLVTLLRATADVAGEWSASPEATPCRERDDSISLYMMMRFAVKRFDENVDQ